MKTHIRVAPVAKFLAADACLCDLSQSERDNIDALYHDADRQRAIAAHWLKRRVLSRFTGREADRLVFTTNEYRKPELIDGPHFNISHAGDWVIIALNAETPASVDVEYQRTPDVWRTLIPVIRHETDANISSLELWTTKEAAAKAKGTGFLTDPREIVIRRNQDGGFSAANRWVANWRWLDDTYMAACMWFKPI